MPDERSAWTTPTPLELRRRLASLLGVAGILLAALAWVRVPGPFLLAYQGAFALWLGVVLGSLAFCLRASAHEGAALAVFQAAGRTVPVLAVLSLPLALNLRSLYLWALPPVVAHDTRLTTWGPYLNAPSMLARALACFAVWWALARLGARGRGTDGAVAWHLSALALSTAVAGVDWLVSSSLPGPTVTHVVLDGLGYLLGALVSAVAFGLCILASLAVDEPGVLPETLLRRQGQLALALAALWALASAPRFACQNPVGAVCLVGAHLLLPLLLVLATLGSRLVGGIAGALLLSRALDVFWLGRAGGAAHWLDAAVPVALGGVWSAYFFAYLDQRPPRP